LTIDVVNVTIVIRYERNFMVKFVYINKDYCFEMEHNEQFIGVFDLQTAYEGFVASCKKSIQEDRDKKKAERRELTSSKN